MILSGIIAASGGGPLTIASTGATLTQDAAYYYYTYTTSTNTNGAQTGTLSVLNGTLPIDYLLVAGGGVGGDANDTGMRYDDGYTMGIIMEDGAGGGAGGVLTGSMDLNSGTYGISVGNSGTHQTNMQSLLKRGRDTSAFGLKAYGGGAANNTNSSFTRPVRNGGSGAGGGYATDFWSDETQTEMVFPNPAQGNNGGLWDSSRDSIYRFSYNGNSSGYRSCFSNFNEYFIQQYFGWPPGDLYCLQGLGTGGGALGPGFGGAGSSGWATSVWEFFGSQTSWSWTANMSGSTTNPDGLSALGLKVGFGGDSVEFLRNPSLATQANQPNTGSGGGHTNFAQAGVVRARITKSLLPAGAIVGAV